MMRCFDNDPVIGFLLVLMLASFLTGFGYSILHRIYERLDRQRREAARLAELMYGVYGVITWDEDKAMWIVRDGRRMGEGE